MLAPDQGALWNMHKMVWLIAPSINLSVFVKAKTSCGLCFKFDMCGFFNHNIMGDRDIDLSPPSSSVLTHRGFTNLIKSEAVICY